VVVCAVDVQVGRGVCVHGVGKRVLGGKHAAIFVGAEDEVMGADGEGFDFGEDAPGLEDFGGVGRDLNTCSDLGFC